MEDWVKDKDKDRIVYWLLQYRPENRQQVFDDVWLRLFKHYREKDYIWLSENIDIKSITKQQ